MNLRFLCMILCIIILAATACRKSKNENDSLISRMGGNRFWHGFYSNGSYLINVPSSSGIYKDTVFAVSVIDKTTISVLGKTFVIDSLDQTKSIVYFRDPYGTRNVWNYYNYGFGEGVAYFCKNDSIAIVWGERSRTHIAKSEMHTFR